MSLETWTAVDRYISEQLVGPDPALEDALTATTAAEIPPIAVSPAQGKLLHLLARAIGARTILEIGTLGGYSTIWLARALAPGGRLITLEADAKHAEVARANIEHAGLGDVVDLRTGKALDTLPELAKEGAGPFDLIFIDADKQRTPDYYIWALELSHPGTLIIADNVVRDGDLADATSGDPGVKGGRRLHELLAAERTSAQRVSATTIQTVGVKGYDGFTLALVLPEPDGVATGSHSASPTI
jgi:predicted O-methyltransferase YrrM